MVAARDRGALDPRQPPPSIKIVVAAHLSLLGVIRAAASALAGQIACDESCEADLELATDELAAVVIADARAWSELELVLTHDDEDIYVRMSVERADAARRLEVSELSQLLLAATVESFDLRAEGERTYAVLQRPRSGLDSL